MTLANSSWSELEQQLRGQIETHAAEAFITDNTQIQGFGLAREKTEGQAIRFDQHSDFMFGGYFTGRETEHRWRKLLAKADAEIRRASGLRQWDVVFWRAVPEITQERDFAEMITKTKLWFRGSFIETASRARVSQSDQEIK